MHSAKLCAMAFWSLRWFHAGPFSLLQRVLDLVDAIELCPSWPGATEFVSEPGSDVTEASGCSGGAFCPDPMVARRRLQRTDSASFCVLNSLCESDHVDDSQSLNNFEAVVAGAPVEAEDSFVSWAALAGTSLTGFLVKLGHMSSGVWQAGPNAANGF